MLQYLKIENLALLKSLTVEFDRGLSVVTGETGAGKSVLLGAFNLLSGARSNQSMIRQGADRLSLEASFFFENTAPIDALLSEYDLPLCEEGTLILFRSLDQSKQSKIRINGALATLSQLKAIGEFWIDFHGPGEPQKLFVESCQLALLDAYAQNEVILKDYQKVYREWRGLCRSIDQLKHSERLDADALRFIGNELKKMEQIDLSETGIADLESNFTKVSRAQDLQTTLEQCLASFSREAGLMDQLNLLNQGIRSLSEYDDSLLELSERAQSLQIEADDLHRELEAQRGAYTFDADQIQSITEEMSAWQELKRKYGGSLASLLEEKAKMERQCELQGDIEGSIARLDTERTQLESELTILAEGLRKNRQSGASLLADQASALLLKLGFKKARLAIELHPLEDGGFAEYGRESCRFMFAPNAGQSILPLKKIASSGETARVMLALKTLLADVDQTPVLVFDEVDANVGGEVGRSVGIEMARIAESHQVFCVTHLPQVASLGSQHFLVEKVQDASDTDVQITPIHGDADERRGEIARMLGDRNSSSALAHAKELLS